MNWSLIFLTLFGLVTLFILCLFWAVIEAEWHKREEARKWKEWTERRRKNGY